MGCVVQADDVQSGLNRDHLLRERVSAGDDVADEQVDPDAPGDLEGLGWLVRRDHTVPALAEGVLDELQNGGVIPADEESGALHLTSLPAGSRPEKTHVGSSSARAGVRGTVVSVLTDGLKATTTPLSVAVRELGADLDPVFETLDLAIYVIDAAGLICWQNETAIALWGDRLGARAVSTVAPEFRHRAEQSLARQLLGVEGTVDVDSVSMGRAGERIPVRVRRIALTGEQGVVGVLGSSRVLGVEPSRAAAVRLTPRQHETLRLLADGLSTDQVAAELGVARETARNYIRQLLSSLGVHSRLEAVVRAHELDLV